MPHKCFHQTGMFAEQLAASELRERVGILFTFLQGALMVEPLSGAL